MPHEIFISHSTKDNAATRKICDTLEDAGLGCWIAPRDISPGEPWDDAICRGINDSRLVLLVLSNLSSESEQVKREMLLAMNEHKPILPVRIEDASPGILTYILTSIQWTDAFPDPLESYLPALVTEVQHSLGLVHPTSPPAQPAADVPAPPTAVLASLCASLSTQSTSGPVPLDSDFYIRRPLDTHFLDAVSRRDQMIVLEGPSGMGKTSLLVRGLAFANTSNMASIYTDLQEFNASDFVDIRTFFTALAHSLEDELNLETHIEDHWDPLRSPNINLTRYLTRQVLPAASGPLFWAIDEADRVFSTPFASDVFALFRSWGVQRSVPSDAREQWLNFTLAFTTARAAAQLIADANESAFNVGTWISFHAFTVEDVEVLNRLHGSPLAGSSELVNICELLRGHPHLVQTGLQELVDRKIPLDDLLKQAAAS